MNDVFKDNILLTLRYLEGSVAEVDKISWEEVNKPLNTSLALNLRRVCFPRYYLPNIPKMWLKPLMPILIIRMALRVTAIFWRRSLPFSLAYLLGRQRCRA